MKQFSILFALAAFLASGCDRSPAVTAQDKLYFHWFTIGSDQEFIPLESFEIHLGEEINLERLNGKVLRDSGGLHATIEGRYGLSVGNFRNYIEQDEIFGPAMYSYSGGIHATYFVVSANPDPKLLYQEIGQRKPVISDDDDSYTIDLDLPLFVDPEPET